MRDNPFSPFKKKNPELPHYFNPATFFAHNPFFRICSLSRIVLKWGHMLIRIVVFAFHIHENSTMVMSYFGLKGMQPNHQLQTPPIPKEAEATSSRGNSILFAISSCTQATI